MLALASCTLPRGVDPSAAAGAPTAYLARVAARESAQWSPFPTRGEQMAAMDPQGTWLLVAARDRNLLEGASPTLAPAVRAWLEGGGRMILFGYAARLVHELGIEPRVPDRCEPFRWGWDHRTRQGVYEFGVRVVAGAAPNFVEPIERALTPDPDHMRTFFLGGGCPSAHQVCLWEGYPPGRGVVLGAFARERDGVFAGFDAASLTYWKVGEGAVFACSHVPEPDSAAVGAADNGTALAAVLARLGRPGFDGSDVALALPGPVYCSRVAAPSAEDAAGEESVPGSLAPLSARPIPGQNLAAGWGWEFGPRLRAVGDHVQAAVELVDRVLLPSWRAGATLADLRLGSADDGYPIAWSSGDPIRRPPSYGEAFWTGWSSEAVGSLAAEAHRRGMLLRTRLDPVPAGRADLQGDGGGQALAALRFLARELGDVRGLGDAAIDGLGVGAWPQDGGTPTLEIVEGYHPGAQVYATGLDQDRRLGLVGVADARWGQPAGVPAAGTSDRWRLPIGGQRAARLDAGETVPADGIGGGSFGDWIVAQAHSFVRRQLGRGPVMWWRAAGEGLDARTRAYVEGVSLDPLRAAVAGRLMATGVGGWRDLMAQLYAPVQDGFGAEVPWPAHTPFLQNNYLRLHGTGGGLELDPGGLARFGEDPGGLVARPFFVSTRYRGQAPRLPEVSESILFLEDGGGAPGQWGQRAAVEWSRVGRDPVPRGLGRGVAPRWPESVTIRFSPPPGQHELYLTLRTESGRGVVALRREGEVVRLLPFDVGGEPTAHRLPFPVSIAGERTFTLEVLHGGSVLLEDFRLVRVADLATETRVVEAAGHRAVLEEWTRSPDVQTVTRLTMVADLPAFAMVVERGAAAQNLQALRTFHLPDYTMLGTALDRDGSGRIRGGFMLHATREGLPPLAVVPFQLSRHEHFAMGDEGLELRSQPAANTTLGVGFVFLVDPAMRAQAPDELLGALQRLFVDMVLPPTLDLSSGEAVLSQPVPFPWVRTVQLVGGAPSPVMVEEKGIWTTRGVQAAEQGGAWLRVYADEQPRIRVRAGGALVRGTRPGPGCGHVLALVDPKPHAVEVRVLQPHAMLSQPSVVMGAAFDEVRINGEPWAHYRGQQVFLPPALGAYRVETRVHGVGREPHVAATRARVLAARWSPRPGLRGAGVLELLFQDAGDDRAASAPYTAWIVGPEPTRIEGAVRVAEREFAFPPAVAARAQGAGVILRFRPGVVRVHYE